MSDKKNLIYLIILVAIFCSLLFFAFSKKPFSVINYSDIKIVQIGSANIKVELALTEAEQIQGLSGRTSLTSDTGMLFVFAKPAYWGIWMKDMNFPIDVLWITDNLKVNYVVGNMTPKSYPKAYKPITPARYVLELPAGTVEKYKIAEGQSVFFK